MRLIAVELLENKASFNAGKHSGEYLIFLSIFSDLVLRVEEDTTYQTAHPKSTILSECPIISFTNRKSTKKAVFFMDNVKTIDNWVVLGELRGELS